jgi:hypothetical protein
MSRRNDIGFEIGIRNIRMNITDTNRSIAEPPISRVVWVNHNSPNLQQRLWNVTSMAVLLAPTSQFVRTGAIFIRQAQLADLFLKLSSSR